MRTLLAAVLSYFGYQAWHGVSLTVSILQLRQINPLYLLFGAVLLGCVGMVASATRLAIASKVAR